MLVTSLLATPINKVVHTLLESNASNLKFFILPSVVFSYLTKKDILRIFIEDMKGSGQNVDVKLLNTKINQTDKGLLTNMIEEATNKKKQMLSPEQVSNFSCGYCAGYFKWIFTYK